MSRIGKAPVVIPEGVTVTEDNNTITVKGPRGTLEMDYSPNMTVEIEDNQVLVSRPNDAKQNRALHGLTRALINNMVEGVTKGFSKTLEINGVGYRALKKGNTLVLNIGYSHPVEIEDPEGIETKVDGPTKVIIEGNDKQAVGQHAANIRAKRPPEPYKGHGIKYSDEHIRRKVGKTT